MSKKCWMCNFETNLSETDYGDHPCPECGVIISVYDPNSKPLPQEVKPTTSHDDWLQQKEKKVIPKMFSGDFLKVEDVKTGDILTFLDGGFETKSTNFTYEALTAKGTPHPKAGQPKDEFHIKVSLMDNTEKTLKLNKPSWGNLSGKWGTDTEDWIGKSAKVTIVPLPNGKNKMILLEVVE